MANEVNFELHSLGWKAFQDLCVAVASEVLARPVQTFLPSKDGGRDGAFVGTWEDAPIAPSSKSTIQCKFVGKPNVTLSLSKLESEIEKIPSLAERGLAYDYVLMTNAGVSGASEAKISAELLKAGAKQCRVFGGDWLIAQIRERPRLRMMVPRLYGLGDLSQIIDERAYNQARYILSAMGDDLRCFVITDAHRKSVKALTKHGFVLLLGDPASGKSTIGASLAIGALDTGSIGTIRISSAEEFVRHWNPHEPSQFFWVDDAFGATQYQPTLADGWNRQLPLLSAALKSGARILLTSRNYIWESAKRVKINQFPLLKQSQVVIDVQNLKETEKAQILYNHIRLGDQPREVRKKIKPILPQVAQSPKFLPEAARRLGSTFFTSSLSIDHSSVLDFAERPVQFLNDVLRNLDPVLQAAVALIFLSGAGGVPSPLRPSLALETATRLFGISNAEIARSLQHLEGSLTLLVQHPDESRWVYKHPTIADAFAALVGESPELVEIYVEGAKLERLVDEVVCGDIDIPGARVRVGSSLYEKLVARLPPSIDDATARFLTNRGDKLLREKYFKDEKEIAVLVERIDSEMSYDAAANLVAKLAKDGLLSETLREVGAARIIDLTISMVDSAVFHDDDIRVILSDDEFELLARRFEVDVADRIDEVASDWEHRLISGDKAAYLEGLRENLDHFARYKEATERGVSSTLIRGIRKIEERVEEIRSEEEEADRPVIASAPTTQGKIDSISAIFDDVDD